MLLGLWKSVQELEENISLDELDAILKEARKRESDRQRFQAAINGINLDEGSTNKFEEVKRKAEARLMNKSVDELELAELGIDIETE